MSTKRLALLLVFLTLPCACAAATDRWLQLERIDVRPDGSPTAARASISSVSISDDGRWVVFASTAANLVNGDSNGFSDVFVRDRHTATTRRLSVRAGGAQATAASTLPTMNSNGRFVSFNSIDNQLVPADSNNAADHFVLDRDSDGNGMFDEAGGTSITRASVNGDGNQLPHGVLAARPAVSEKGLSHAFSTRTAIATTDGNGAGDVYVRDRVHSRTPLASRSTEGLAGNGESPDFFQPPIVMDAAGRRIVFSSNARNLGGGDSNSDVDIFLHDRDSDGNGVPDEIGGVSTTRLSVDDDGTRLRLPATVDFQLGRDGRQFVVTARHPTGDNPGGTDVWFRDLATPGISPITFVASAWAKPGNTGCCGNQNVRISRNGRVIAFRSNQNFSFQSTTTSRSDIFVKSRGKDLTRLTDFPVPAQVSDGYSASVDALSDSGAYLVTTVLGAGTSTVNDGVFVHQRDSIFDSGLEPESLP